MADEAGVFVRVSCPTCGRNDVFLKCDQCGRQSLFVLSDQGVSCSCGASYGHALCTCGAQVPPANLVAVPFDKGPLSWSELEFDPRRIAASLLVLTLPLALVLWWLFR